MNIRKGWRLFFVLLSIITLLFSCSVVGENDTKIAFTDDVIVLGRAKQTLNKPIDFTLKIKDGSGSFVAIEASKNVSGWFFIPGYDTNGFTLTVVNAVSNGDTSINLRLNTDSTLLREGLEQKEFYLSIPASFLDDRLNNVLVDSTGYRTFVNILDSDSSSSYVRNISNTLTSLDGYVGEAISDFSITFALEGNTFASDISADKFDISGWFAPIVKGLSYKLASDIKQGENKFTVVISGTPEEAISNKKIPLKINSSFLTRPNNIMFADYMPKYNIIAATTTAVATSVDRDIKGVTTNYASDETVDSLVTVTLRGGASIASALPQDWDISSWILNPVPGLKYQLTSQVQSGATTFMIKISGAPTSPSNEVISISIPKSQNDSQGGGTTTILNGVTDRVGTSIPVKTDIRYDIKTGDFYDWRLYDSASFTDFSVKDLSPNASFTTASDSSSLVTEDASTMLLASGKSVSVAYPKGLKRPGYTLKGFTIRYRDGAASDIDPSYIVYKWNNEDFADNSTSLDDELMADTLGVKSIKELVLGRLVDLYAIWERDTSSIYFKEAMNITITKAQVDAANPDDATGTDAEKANYASLKDLKMHDGKTALASDWKQEFKFIALPGGKIGGTKDAPEYFKWPVSWRLSKNPSTYGNIMNDFAISDIALTPALWNVVYAWATSDERDANKYTFTFDSSQFLLAGIDNPLSTSVSRHSAEDPLVRINWYNAVIFANALTEWYNAVVANGDGEKLTVAYTSDGTASGTVLRNANDTVTLDKINSGENNVNTSDSTKSGLKRVADATGFRLPTRTEWQYAASVLPGGVPSDWNKSVTTHTKSGNMYPFIQSYAYASGVDGGIQTTNTKLKDYCVYSELYSGKSDYGTQTVGKYFAKDNVRTNGAKPNQLGLYDMSGNTYNWAEEWYGFGGTSDSRFLSGGSWSTPADYLYVGYAHYMAPRYRHYDFGVRFCRSLAPKIN